MTNDNKLPLLYKRISLLTAERHRDRTFKRTVGFNFAAGTNSLPLTLAEFPAAVRHYPIVFTTGDTPVPIALVGLRQDHNSFVQKDGTWRPGCYIPAYVRRYPFLLAVNSDDNKLSLCIDEESEHYRSGGDVLLFKVDGPTDEIKAILEFCGEYQSQWVQTQEFGKAIHAAGLLEPKQITIKQGEESKTLAGFQAINEAKFSEVSDEQFLEWRRRGWVGMVYCHLISMGCVQALAETEGGNSISATRA